MRGRLSGRPFSCPVPLVFRVVYPCRMTRFFISLTAALFVLAGCDTIASGTASTAGFAAKQTVRGGYAVGKTAVRGGAAAGRAVIPGGRGDDTD